MAWSSLPAHIHVWRERKPASISEASQQEASINISTYCSRVTSAASCSITWLLSRMGTSAREKSDHRLCNDLWLVLTYCTRSPLLVRPHSFSIKHEREFHAIAAVSPCF